MTVARKDGVVLWGARNIFTVREADGTTHDHLRIKGKLLEIDEEAHNPLAPGDRVVIENGGSGFVVVDRLHRQNAVTRWNRKRRRLQTVAANVDHLYLVTNAGEPRYRPQFVDRVLVMAELGAIPTAIVLNKNDLALPVVAQRHLAVLSRAGYPVLRTIAVGELDLAALPTYTRGGVVCLIGQSGVGKSSLINALAPGTDLTVGEVSHRYRRGRHTTTLARHVLAPDGTVYIDTPGVREFDLFGYEIGRIAAGFREFAPYTTRCELSDCSHTHEPGCALRAAAETDTDLDLRYRSYRAILADLRRHDGRVA